MRIPAFPALFGLCVIASSASAQVGAIDPLSVPSGTQARIIGVGSSTDFIKLTVIDVNRDSVRYRLNSDAGTKSLAWQRISRMDVSGGHHSNIVRGLGFGFLAGLVGGAIRGASTASGQDGYNAGPGAVFNVFWAGHSADFSAVYWASPREPRREFPFQYHAQSQRELAAYRIFLPLTLFPTEHS